MLVLFDLLGIACQQLQREDCGLHQGITDEVKVIKFNETGPEIVNDILDFDRI